MNLVFFVRMLVLRAKSGGFRLAARYDLDPNIVGVHANKIVLETQNFTELFFVIEGSRSL